MSRLARSAPLLGLVLLTLSTAAGGQGAPAVHVTRWTTADGLPQGTVNEIVQADDGELWLATFGGLVRFDGMTFRTLDLDHPQGPPSNRITSLAKGPAGGLWAATQDGHLLFYEGRAFRRSLAVPEAVDVLALADGTLFGRFTNGTLSRFDGAAWSECDRIPGEPRYEGLIEVDGRVLLAAEERVRVFDSRGDLLATHETGSRTTALAAAHEGGAWVGVEHGVLRLADGRLEQQELDPPLASEVAALLEDARGGLWIGTLDGLRYARRGEDGRAWSVSSPAVELARGFSVREIVGDREGNLWVGSAGQGLARLAPLRVREVARGADSRSTTALSSDAAGGLWLAGECDGLWHLAAGAAAPNPFPLPTGLEDRRCVQSLLCEPSGRLWIGASRQLVCKEAGAPAGAVVGPRFEGRIGPLLLAPDGSLCVATLSGEFARLDGQGTVLEQALLPGRVHSMTMADDGSLWFGGSGVVWHRRADGLATYDDRIGVPRGDVRDILLDPDGVAWLATYGGGLGRLVGGRCARIGRAKGLPDSSLTRILEDAGGRLWLLSNAGLCVVEREPLSAVAEGRRAVLEPILLGPEAGVAEANYGNPSGFRDERGRMWFGTLDGPLSIDADAFPFNRTPPRPRIENVAADAVGLEIAAPTIVPAGARRLQIDFTAFALTAPERVLFRYRLEGFDDAWDEASAARQATFTALDPGEYEFQVSARNEHGVWSDHPATLALRVLPAWWQTTPVRAGAALAAVGLLLALHRLRILAVHRRAGVLIEATQGRARAEERESHLRDELAHLARVATAGELATSLAHEVNQPLAAMVSNAQAGRRLLELQRGTPEELAAILGDIEQDARRASEVIKRLRSFVDKRASERVPTEIEPLLRSTLTLLRREVARLGIAVQIDVADGLPAVTVDPVQLQQVFLNLLKNACESLADAPHPRRLAVVARSADDGIELDVRDSGAGLDPGVAERLFQPFVTTKSEGMGLGLALCTTIVEAHGGRLAALDTPDAGATFRIALPFEDRVKPRDAASPQLS